MLEPLQYQMEHTYLKLNAEKMEMEKSLRTNLIEVTAKLDNIEEKYFALNQMDVNTFNKFHARYIEEKNTITRELEQCNTGSSNYQKAIEIALQISQNLNRIWASGTIAIKERLQKLVFPEGIYYNHEKGAFRTDKVNVVFELIASLSSVSGGNKKGTKSCFDILSLSAG